MLRIRRTSTCGGRVKIRVQLSLNTSLKEPDLYILLKNAPRYARIHKALGAKKHYFCKEPLFGERQFVIKKSRYIRFALTWRTSASLLLGASIPKEVGTSFPQALGKKYSVGTELLTLGTRDNFTVLDFAVSFVLVWVFPMCYHMPRKLQKFFQWQEVWPLLQHLQWWALFALVNHQTKN